MAAERKQPAARGVSARTDAQRSAQDAAHAPSPIEEHAPGGTAQVSASPDAGDAKMAKVAKVATSPGPRHGGIMSAWPVAGRWLRVNSWLPSWFPARWRFWSAAYLTAALLQVAAVALTALISGVFPSFPFQGALETLIIVFVALNFGAGPSLLATFLGAALLGYAVLPARLEWTLTNEGDLVSLALFIVIGCTASILASQTERARSAAEAAREQAERFAATLADERARLEAVIEATPDRVTIFDEQGRIERMNAAAQATAGPQRGAEELPDYQQAYGLRLPSGEPWPTDELPLRHALQGETIADVEMLSRDSEGCDRSMLASAAPIRDAKGQIRGAVAISHDITALREIQQAVVERASQLEAIIESMVAGVFVYDMQGRILRTNASARKLFGFDALAGYATLTLGERLARVETRDAQGQPVPEEQSPQRRVLRGETLVGDETTDYWLRVLDGRDVMVNVSGAPVRSADGRMYGGVLILRDVTEQRRFQRRTREALDAVLAMAQTLVELPPDLPESASQNGLPVAQRIAFLTRQVLGCTRIGITTVEPETGRLRGVAVVGLSPDQERQWWAEQREAERRGVRLSEGADPEDLARFLAGETFALDMTQPPYADLPNPYGVTTSLFAPMLIGGQVIGVLSLDYGGPPHVFTSDEIKLAGAVAQLGAVILERDRLLRERAEAQASLLAAQEANQRMDEFLSIAGHELKTPITTAHASLQLVERRLRRLDEELMRLDGPLGEQIKPLLASLPELIRRADSATKRQSRQVDDLLDISRLQSGRLDLRIETCDLAALVRETVEDHQLHWPDRTISATLPEGQALVAADPDRTAQVITNFLTNALKYSPGDTPVHVTLTRDAGVARVRVKDDGPGIPEAMQARLWERFYRAPDIEAQSGSGAGLGLGLYICHEIIARHGGEIGVESQPGAGSTFWFTLPLARD